MKKYFFSKFSPTSYVKLQDAYVSENNGPGNWVTIGFIAPGASSASDVAGNTPAFAYTGGSAAPTITCPDGFAAVGDKCKMTENGKETFASALSGDLEAGFVATSNAKLNDCMSGTAWRIDTKVASGTTTYTKTIGGEAPSANAACNALTPQFANIGK